MDEFPELTCIRGEAVIYEHIERHDPETFRRIKKQVAAGRWDIVGGTWLQADTNLPATETLCRHFEVGKAYFRSRFGKTPEIAWAADSFGHSAGLPEILTASGMKGIAFTRTGGVVPPKPAFWWESPSGARVLAYRSAAGWYGCDREEMPKRLDCLLASSLKCDLENIGVFYGMGDHGGGPTRKMLRDINAWQAAHPEVTVVHSGLHRLFAALFKEASRKGDSLFPVHRGELNFCLRGCYSSVAKFKYA
jgi:alpha-mannosidase